MMDGWVKREEDGRRGQGLGVCWIWRNKGSSWLQGPGQGWKGVGEKYVAGAVRIADCRNFGEGSGPSPSCCQGSSGRGSP